MEGNDKKKNEKSNHNKAEIETNAKVSEKNYNDTDIRNGEWMIRPCDVYNDEYKDCRSIASRFQQYFVDGENTPCQQWKIDYDNCKKWKNKNDDQAYNDLLKSEQNRRLNRLKGNINNNVWEPRKNPPDDWNDPLPEWLHKRNEGTFLAMKQKLINETGVDDDKDLYLPSCVIS